jgi:hypothetical protein
MKEEDLVVDYLVRKITGPDFSPVEKVCSAQILANMASSRMCFLLYKGLIS